MGPKITVDSAVGDIGAPASVKTAALPVPAAQNVTVTEVGKGIWHLGGSGANSILFEFDDHLIRIGDEVRREKSAIELHSFDDVDIRL